jgi:hypothetical protein
MRQLSPKKEEEDTYIKYSSTILSFFQKARTVRNTKRHFAFGKKTFALRVRVALMNIWIIYIAHRVQYMLYYCYERLTCCQR